MQYCDELLFLNTRIERKGDTWEEKDTINAWVWPFQKKATPHFLNNHHICHFVGV